MVKKSSLLRELKRQKLVKKFLKKRILFLTLIKKTNLIKEKCNIHQKLLQRLPKNSVPIRLRNRCWKTGKSRGYIRFFGVCRNVLRELTHECLLPGIIKSSW